MVKIWMWLSGKKTLIGAAVTGVAAATRYLGYNELADTFQEFANVLIGLGFAHKIKKSISGGGVDASGR